MGSNMGILLKMNKQKPIKGKSTAVLKLLFMPPTEAVAVSYLQTGEPSSPEMKTLI